MSEHPLDSPLVKRSERFARINECVHDQTKQRKFEKSFFSLEWMNENGDAFDYGDCGKAAKQLFIKLDWYWLKQEGEERWQAALEKLEKYPKLKETLEIIREVIESAKEKPGRENFFQPVKLGLMSMNSGFQI